MSRLPIKISTGYGVSTDAKKVLLCAMLLFAITSRTHAQDQGKILQQKISDWQIANFQEKVYVHTDKEFYLAGETAWFSVYDVDASFHLRSPISKVVYVELLDKSRQAVLQGKIELKEGRGSGSFYLPFTLRSGNYQLRAYTSWMKNFSSSFFFSKFVTIVNTSENNIGNDSIPEMRYSATFFPEGGHLLKDVGNRVAFKFNDQWGRGVNGRGWIINSQLDTVSAFSSGKFGMGVFDFRPISTEPYHASIQLENGHRLHVSMPVAAETGLNMKMLMGNSGQAEVTVNGKGVQGNIYLVVQNRGTRKWMKAAVLENDMAHFKIPVTGLGDGINQVTIFNNQLQPICERLWFQYPDSEFTVKVGPFPGSIAPRTGVQVNLETMRGSLPVPADLSLSVYRMDSLENEIAPGIDAYLLLASDIVGYIESASYYFSDVGTDQRDAMNVLMMTQGWRRFKWESVLNPVLAKKRYPPEMNGHIITGTLQSRKDGRLISGGQAYLGIPGNGTKFYPALSDRNGRLRFEVKDYYGEAPVIVQAGDSVAQVIVESPFFTEPWPVDVPAFFIGADRSRTLNRQHVYAQVRNAYNSRMAAMSPVMTLDSIPFYGKSNALYHLDKYTRFSTVEDVLREYVREVSVTRSGGNFHLQVYNSPVSKYFDADPLVLLDGIPLLNMNRVVDLDAQAIRSIEVVTHRYYLGDMYFDGIVNCRTYASDLAGYVPDARMSILDYNGMQEFREFYTPDYIRGSNHSARIPDYRTVLQWVPLANTNNDGMMKLVFQTSDIPGKYALVIQALSSSGEPASITRYFKVTGEER